MCADGGSSSMEEQLQRAACGSRYGLHLKEEAWSASTVEEADSWHQQEARLKQI